MQTTVPLVGVPNRRNFDPLTTQTNDQRFIGTLFNIVQNPVTKQATVYVEKRPGFEAYSTPASGSAGHAISDDGIVTAWGATTPTIYYNTTSCGQITTSSSVIRAITRATIAGDTYYLFATQTEGYYLNNSVVSVSTTFTANTTSGSATLASPSSTSGLQIGQLITGTGIPAGTRILTVSPSVTMTANATATNNTVTITREHIAKIIDADFPSTLDSGFVYLDGYLFILTGGTTSSAKRLYNSDLNSVTSWTAGNYTTASAKPGNGSGLFRIKNYIVAFTTECIEFFYNAGNSTGSPLNRATQFQVSFGTSTPTAFQKGQAQLGDTIVFADSGRGENQGVWMLDADLTPKRISTQVIERMVQSEQPLIDIFTSFGGTYVQLLFTSSSASMLYHVESGIWTESGFPGQKRVCSIGRAVDISTTTGKIYVWDNDSPSFTDDSVAYTMTIQTSRSNLGTNKRKTVNRISLVADKQASGTVTLEKSDDDFATWQTLGTFDLTKMNPTITGGKSHVGGRAYRLTHSANTAFRAEALEIEYEVGAI